MLGKKQSKNEVAASTTGYSQQPKVLEQQRVKKKYITQETLRFSLKQKKKNNKQRNEKSVKIIFLRWA